MNIVVCYLYLIIWDCIKVGQQNLNVKRIRYCEINDRGILLAPKSSVVHVVRGLLGLVYIIIIIPVPASHMPSYTNYRTGNQRAKRSCILHGLQRESPESICLEWNHFHNKIIIITLPESLDLSSWPPSYGHCIYHTMDTQCKILAGWSVVEGMKMDRQRATPSPCKLYFKHRQFLKADEELGLCGLCARKGEG